MLMVHCIYEPVKMLHFGGIDIGLSFKYLANVFTRSFRTIDLTFPISNRSKFRTVIGKNAGPF